MLVCNLNQTVLIPFKRYAPIQIDVNTISGNNELSLRSVERPALVGKTRPLQGHARRLRRDAEDGHLRKFGRDVEPGSGERLGRQPPRTGLEDERRVRTRRERDPVVEVRRSECARVLRGRESDEQGERSRTSFGCRIRGLRV